MKSVRSAVVAIVMAAGVAGCSMGNDSKSASSSSSSPTTSTSASSPSSSSSATSASPSSSSSPASSVALPAGTQLAKATDTKLSFAVPKGWAIVDEETAKTAEVKKQLEPLAKKAGTSAEKFAANFTGTADVLAIDSSATKPFNDNVNVIKMTRPALPTKAEYAKELSAAKMQAGEFTSIETPAGHGIQQTYTMTMKGTTVHGVSMVVPNGEGTYSTVTVSSGTAQGATAYAKDIVATANKL